MSRRIRPIKPQLAENRDLFDCGLHARIAYPLLACHADCEGRLVDDPMRIKILVLPFDDVDADKVLNTLARPRKSGEEPFIVRYQVHGRRYIQFSNWRKHVHITGEEAKHPSKLPGPDQATETIAAPEETDLSRWFSEVFWPAYPVKKNRDRAEKRLRDMNPDPIECARIMGYLNLCVRTDWANREIKFVPYPETFLKAGDWKHIQPINASTKKQMPEGWTGSRA